MILIFGILVLLIVLVGYFFYSFYKDNQTFLTKGLVIKKMYEAVNERYYIVVKIGNDKDYVEYLEYTCTKYEWMGLNEEDEVTCEIETLTFKIKLVNV